MTIFVDLTATKKDLRAKDKELKDALSEQKKHEGKVESLGEKLTEQVEYLCRHIPTLHTMSCTYVLPKAGDNTSFINHCA